MPSRRNPIQSRAQIALAEPTPCYLCDQPLQGDVCKRTLECRYYCSRERGQMEMRRQKGVATVYLIGAKAQRGDYVKIGTSVDPYRPQWELQLCSPVALGILWTTAGDQALEHEFHQLWADRRSHGEWFDLGDDPIKAMTAADDWLTFHWADEKDDEIIPFISPFPFDRMAERGAFWEWHEGDDCYACPAHRGSGDIPDGITSCSPYLED